MAPIQNIAVSVVKHFVHDVNGVEVTLFFRMAEWSCYAPPVGNMYGIRQELRVCLHV